MSEPKTPGKRMEHRLPERFVPRIDYDLCRVCKRCVSECSYQALEFKESKVVPAGGCVACGRCIAFCPANCIEIRPVPPQFAHRVGLHAHQRAADYTVAKLRLGYELLDNNIDHRSSGESQKPGHDRCV